MEGSVERVEEFHRVDLAVRVVFHRRRPFRFPEQRRVLTAGCTVSVMVRRRRRSHGLMRRRRRIVFVGACLRSVSQSTLLLSQLQVGIQLVWDGVNFLQSKKFCFSLEMAITPFFEQLGLPLMGIDVKTLDDSLTNNHNISVICIF